MKSKNGFSLIEVIVVIALAAILSGTTLSVFTNALDDARFDSTYREMLQIRKALIGELEHTNLEGQRIRFGYLGDNGNIPTSAQGLSALMSLPTSAAIWAMASSGKIGVGWNGPYIVANSGSDYTRDAWGRNYIYNTTGTPYLLSYGADGVAGGSGNNADIQVDVPINLRMGTVSGQILTSGSVWQTDAVVTLYYPSLTGTLSSSVATLSAANSGAFTFSSIPFGIRSVKIDTPNSANPQFTVGPMIFPHDNPNYFIPEYVTEVNPDPSVNCNGIVNTTYVSGTWSNGDSSKFRVDFKLNIRKAFTVSSIYFAGHRSDGDNTIKKVMGISINGVYYGCTPGKRGRTLNSDRSFIPVGCSGIDVRTPSLSNVSLNSVWSIPAGTNIISYIDFKDDSSKVDSITIRLGCDLFTIAPP